MTKAKQKLKTDADILVMIEKEIIDRIYHSSLRYTKANNEYMKKEMQ